MGYRLTGVVITAFWLVTMAWLMVAEVLPDLEPLPTPGYQRFLARLTEERVDRMGVYFGTRRLGFTERTYRRLPDGGYLIVSRYEMAMEDSLNLLEGMLPGRKSGSGKLAFKMLMNARVGDDYQLEQFDIEAEIGGTRQRILGTMHAGELMVTSVVDGKQQQQKVPFDTRTVLGGLLSPSEYAGKLRLGHAWDVRFIDPFTGKQRTARRRVIRREKVALRSGDGHETFVVETRFGESVTTAWVAPDGRVMREQRPFGIRLERESRGGR